MTFLWPLAFWTLTAPLLLVAIYLWMLRRRRKHAVHFANLALVRAAAGKRNQRRHLPFALIVASLVLIAVAAARPQTSQTVELNRTTILLALDTSTSMCAVDVEPNRLAAARSAVADFIAATPEGTRVGIVTFSAATNLAVPPTDDRAVLTEAVETLITSRGTAIGSAILESVDAIAEENPDVIPTGVAVEGDAAGNNDDDPTTTDFVPDIVVLMTDGAASAGVDPIVAAQEAADRRVRVYTIGFGTDEPIALSCTADQLGPGGFGGTIELNEGNDYRGFRDFLLIDEATLETVADMTGGSYFRATDANQLSDIFQELPSQVQLQTEETEQTAWFVLAAIVPLLLAIGLSLRWNRYP